MVQSDSYVDVDGEATLEASSSVAAETETESQGVNLYTLAGHESMQLWEKIKSKTESFHKRQR